MYKEQIEEIERKIKNLKEVRRQILKAWVNAEHPLKIGDIVEAHGYGFNSKIMKVN